MLTPEEQFQLYEQEAEDCAQVKAATRPRSIAIGLDPVVI